MAHCAAEPEPASPAGQCVPQHPALTNLALHPTPLLLPQAAYPAPWVKAAKFWPTTSRVDNVYGDRHLVLRLPAADAAEPQAAVA